MNRLLIFLSVAAFFTMTSPALQAQQPICDTERAMLDTLYKRFREFPVFRGDEEDGRKIIITRSDGVGSWTLLSVFNGRACIQGGGFLSRFDRGI